MKSRVFSLVLTAVIVSSFPAAAWCPDNWTRDPANPILAEAVASTVMFHEDIYKMWFEWVDGIGYATSPDGRVWEKHPANPVLVPGPEPYDTLEVSSASVVIVDGIYHMWYSSIDNDEESHICYATSPNGIDWNKHLANPVMNEGSPGDLDDSEVIHPFVIYEEPIFRMWYNGHDGDTQRILYATSPTGTSWVRDPNAVLDVGVPGEWDAGHAMMSVLPFEGSYYMWYTVFSTDGKLHVGYATSPDGTSWVKRAPSEPVFSPDVAGTWDSAAVGAAVVLATNTELLMWYGGSSAGWETIEHFQTGIATACHPVAVPDPSNIQISRVLPNPFTSSTTIQYTLSTPSWVVLRIQDAAGRTVCRMIDGQTIAAGPHRIVWNGRDDKGQEVPAGVYFYRLEFEDFTETEKIVRVR